MRKHKKRTLILSIASAAAVIPGCGDSSDTVGAGQTIVAPGSMIEPARDASSDQSATVEMTTGQMIVPPDAKQNTEPGDAGDADAPRLIIGVVPNPSDASDARPFPGVIIMPQDGSANG